MCARMLTMLLAWVVQASGLVAKASLALMGRDVSKAGSGPGGQMTLAESLE